MNGLLLFIEILRFSNKIDISFLAKPILTNDKSRNPMFRFDFRRDFNI